jgi:hypothetical protein
VRIAGSGRITVVTGAAAGQQAGKYTENSGKRDQFFHFLSSFLGLQSYYFPEGTKYSGIN